MNINTNLSSLDRTIDRGVLFPSGTCDPALTYREPHYHGFCWSCCRPAQSCCCHVHTCRKEAKELLVVPKSVRVPIDQKDPILRPIDTKAAEAEKLHLLSETAEGKLNVETQAADTAVRIVESGTGSAIIGGSCCAHLSIEYMPSLSVKESTEKTPQVAVRVIDSEGTTLMWHKTVHPGSIYQIRENIIVTKPGARLDVEVLSLVARVRWCEIFSC
jgi:hypothetical protein